MDLEPIPGTVGMSWEYNLDETPIQGREPCAHIFTQDPEETHVDTGEAGAVRWQH